MVLDRFQWCSGQVSRIIQAYIQSWTLMSKQYDQVSHQLFLYCIEFKYVVQIADQNMGFAWWFLIWVHGDLDIEFRWQNYKKQSLNVKKTEKTTFQKANPCGYCSCSISFFRSSQLLHIVRGFRGNHSSSVLPPSYPQALWKHSYSSDLEWVLDVQINSYSIPFLVWNINCKIFAKPKYFIVIFNTAVKDCKTYWEGNAFYV